MKKFFKILMVFALLGGATLSCTKDYSQEVVDLKTQDENLKALITSLQSALGGVNQTIETLKANKVDVSVFEAYKAELTADLATLNAAIQKAQGAADAAGALAAENKEAIGKLASDLSDLSKLVNTLQARMDGAEKAIGELEAALAAEVADLEKQIADLKKYTDGQIAALQKALEEQIKQLQTKIGALEEMDVRLSESIKANAAAIDEIKGVLNELENKLETLGGKVETYYAELTGKVAALAGRIQSIVADAPVDANEVSTLVWGGAPEFTANESAANGPASQTITHVHMTFTIVPKECAEALNVENVKLVVTEGLDVTRAPQADLNKEYVPAQVDVEKIGGKVTGRVTVHANIKPKSSANSPAESAYWVALKVNAPDEQNGDYYKMSQFVKATENDEVYKLFDHVSWFCESRKVDSKVPERIVDMRWQPNVVNGTPKPEQTDMKYNKSDLFSEYELRFIMPGGSSMSAAETGALFGITKVDVVPSGVSPAWFDAKHILVTSGNLTKILSFNKNGNVVGFTADFLDGSTTVQNREYVGSQAKYHFGSSDKGENWAMMIGDYPLPGYGLLYTANIIGNTVHADATPDKLDYKWDYEHFAETQPECHIFENCTWNFTLMPLEIAAESWRLTDSIYTKGSTDFFPGRQVGVTTATIDKVAQDLFDFTLTKIPFTEKTQELYAAYHKTDRNSAGNVYTTYSTEIPFTVEPRHDDVKKELSVGIIPNQTNGGTIECDVLAAAFDDFAAAPEKWNGSHTSWGKAKLYQAFISAIAAAYPAGWHPYRIYKDGSTTDIAGTIGNNVSLVPANSGSDDNSIISYGANTFAYDAKYKLVFTATVFKVPFTFTVTLTTSPCPFELVTTPLVKNDTIVLQGRSQWVAADDEYQFTFEQIHFNKYLEVDANGYTSSEDIKLKFTDGKLYRYAESTSPTTAYGTVNFNSLGTMRRSTTTSTSGNYTFVEESNGVLDWNTMGANAFKGRKITVKANLMVGEQTVQSKTLVLVTEEPILKLTTTKAFDLQFTPGEDLVIDLYEALSVKGVYHSPEVKSYEKELLYKPVNGIWAFHKDDVKTPSYAAVLPTIAPAASWTVTLNGQTWAITEGVHYTIVGNILTLKKDNNSGTYKITIPVTLNSCLDGKASEFADFKKISQYAEINITATRL